MPSVCSPLIKVRKNRDFISFIRCQQSLSLSYFDHFHPSNLSSSWTKGNLNKNYSTNIQEKLVRPHTSCFGMFIIQWRWQFYACTNLCMFHWVIPYCTENTHTHTFTINFAMFKQRKVNLKKQPWSLEMLQKRRKTNRATLFHEKKQHIWKSKHPKSQNVEQTTFVGMRFDFKC